MKTALKYLTILGLAIAALTWPSVNVRSTEEAVAGSGENVAARVAYRRLQLQDENGQIPPNALINAYQQKQAMPFLPGAWSAFLQNGRKFPLPGFRLGRTISAAEFARLSFTLPPLRGLCGLAECLAAFGKQPMAARRGARTPIPCQTWV